MAEHEIVSRAPFAENGPDCGAYTLALLQHAAQSGLIAPEDVRRIQEGLLGLLAGQIAKLTHGESSSVPTEAADSLMDGIGYCVDIALLGAPSPAEAARLLKDRTPADLYTQGRALLDTQYKACRSLFARVRATRTKTVNEGYQALLDRTLPGYLSMWEVSDFPVDFPVLIEYPLALEPRQNGIPGVLAVLRALALENRFCGRFSQSLEGLLCDWAALNRTSPEEAYVNLFSILLQNLILCRLLRQDGPSLSAQAAAELEGRLLPLTEEHRKALLLHTAEELLAEWAFDSPALEAYIREACGRFAALLNRAGGRLAAFAVIQGAEGASYIGGERLDNDAFSLIVEEILLCDTPEEKARLIRQEIRSLDDLWDLLNAGCLFDDEFDSVFSAFDTFTYALLLCKLQPVCGENGRLSCTDPDGWQEAFISGLYRRPAPEQAEILKAYRGFLENGLPG